MTVPPSFRKVNPGESAVVFISANSATLPMSTVDEYAEVVLAQQMSQIPGVALVDVHGAQKFAIRVQVDPVAAAARNISLDDIRRVIAATNSNSPVGTLYGPKQNVTLLATAAMAHAEEYKDVVVAWRNGAPVRLQEIAHVIDSVENDKIASWFNDNRSILLAVQRQPSANTVDVVDAIRERLPTYRAQVPAAVNLEVQLDRSRSIRDSVEDVQETLAIAIALVVLVIFLFLRSVAATVIPALAVPVSLIGTCAVMYAFGFSINNMTMLALTLSVGFVVDDAIVMLENIVRHIEGGMRPFEARAQGRQGNRLHHHCDHVLADRGVHSGAADGRHGGARVPRIRGHDRGCHRDLGLRLADADADVVRARAQEPSRGEQADAASAHLRGGLQQLAAGLRMGARQGAQIQVGHAGGHHRNAGS